MRTALGGTSAVAVDGSRGSRGGYRLSLVRRGANCLATCECAHCTLSWLVYVSRFNHEFQEVPILHSAAGNQHLRLVKACVLHDVRKMGSILQRNRLEDSEGIGVVD